MMEKPPTRDVKGANLTKGKIMLERKVMPREYDGHTAAVGDRVARVARVARDDGTEGEVVYVGELQFVVEFESLWVYAKGVRGQLWLRENYIIVNGFLVPAPAEEFAEGLVYIANPGHVEFHYFYRIGRTITQEAKLLFGRGVLHRSAANAIAHAKAMIGIDPYARESLDDAWDERPTPPAGEALPGPGGDAVPPHAARGSSL